MLVSFSTLQPNGPDDANKLVTIIPTGRGEGFLGYIQDEL